MGSVGTGASGLCNGGNGKVSAKSVSIFCSFNSSKSAEGIDERTNQNRSCKHQVVQLTRFYQKNGNIYNGFYDFIDQDFYIDE